MRCKPLAILLAALVLPVAGPTATVDASSSRPASSRRAAAAPPRAQLRDLVCQRAADPSARAVTVTAVMRPVSGTVRLAMKFDLERRTRTHQPFTIVRGRDLGRWASPTNPPTLGQNPGDVWILTHNVVNLLGPASYRFRVSFRWTGARGHLLTEAVRWSPTCFQPEPRADLSVSSISIKPIGAHQDRYTAVVRNGGASAAGRFTLELRVPGSAPQSLAVTSLASHATIREALDGPLCPSGGSVTVIADPGRQVDDLNRANNTLTMPCPAASSS